MYAFIHLFLQQKSSSWVPGHVNQPQGYKDFQHSVGRQTIIKVETNIYKISIMIYGLKEKH